MDERSADDPDMWATAFDYGRPGGRGRGLAVTVPLVTTSLMSGLLAVAMACRRTWTFYTWSWPNGLYTDLGAGALLAVVAVVAGLAGLSRTATRKVGRTCFWAAIAAVVLGLGSLLFQGINSYRY